MRPADLVEEKREGQVEAHLTQDARPSPGTCSVASYLSQISVALFFKTVSLGCKTQEA